MASKSIINERDSEQIYEDCLNNDPVTPQFRYSFDLRKISSSRQ